MLTNLFITLTLMSPQVPMYDAALECRSVDSHITYAEIRDAAITLCKNNKVIDNADLKIIDDLIDIEKTFNVPHSLRGMLLAAACAESGYNPIAKGDYRKGKPKAIGILQLWPWWERAKYKVNRKNHISSARAWMAHVKRQLGKIKCKFKSPRKRWIAAWVTAIRAPKSGGRCYERPKHLRILKKWHREVKTWRRACWDDQTIDGC
jgi:hypothetical protein